jgi:ribosomal protein S18 acetylase RimI-like enzyme
VIRPLLLSDVAAARALFEGECERHPYATRAIEIVEAAAAGGAEGEYSALVDANGDEVRGAVVYGLVAGAIGTGMVYGVAVAAENRRRGAGRALIEAACDDLVAAGARVAIAELPDDAVLSDVHALLARAGFVEEARAPDLVRDGVAIVFRRRDLTAR